VERGGQALQSRDAREAGDGSGEAGPTGSGVGRGHRSNLNLDPGAIRPKITKIKRSGLLYLSVRR
jgi:hypothetical protein